MQKHRSRLKGLRLYFVLMYENMLIIWIIRTVVQNIFTVYGMSLIGV